ncbi:hypothetical protein EDF88_3921 [Buttiauxella sp. BIGb0552]|uniref:hypothetical protein n=1 Tax=Buttiauxella sp. BIGb0552 TaxID=2485120 RepID=UPI001064CC3C|nr:hypothetical protein [Buttiauxella sp. BIGb0552]TDX14604.1 hypothetical protein EDF88_3921 [Buttiauxella sp. BIGb0552]
MKFGKTKSNPGTDSGEATSVTIGEFTISQFGDGSVWIEDGEEDAGSFDEALLIQALRKFYDENF